MTGRIHYTIIATVYNDEAEIHGLLSDIRKQTVQPEEVIIVDGGSVDHTVEVIEGFGGVRLIKGKRLNIAQGLNVAIKSALTDLIGIVAVGNRYNEDFFELLAEEIQESGVDCTYGYLIGRSDTAFARMYKSFLMKGDYGIPTNHGILIKKSVFMNNGFFYEGLRYAGEDAEYYRRLQKRGTTSRCVEMASVYWDTPASYNDYFLQTRRYLLGEYQISTDRRFVKRYGYHILYAIVLLGSIPCVILFGKLGIGVLAMIAAYNLLVMKKGGPGQAVAVNIRAMTYFMSLLWNIPNFGEKIDKNRLLD